MGNRKWELRRSARRHPSPAAPSLQSACGIVNWFVGWYSGLAPDKRLLPAFRQALQQVSLAEIEDS